MLAMLPADREDIVFFDGECGLCTRTVRWLLPRDHRKRFVFAPLHGTTFTREIAEDLRARLPDSLVVRTSSGATHLRSSAVTHILMHLGIHWKIVSALLWVIPKPIRDLGYRGVARVRKRLFPPDPMKEFCARMSPDLRQRFLP